MIRVWVSSEQRGMLEALHGHLDRERKLSVRPPMQSARLGEALVDVRQLPVRTFRCLRVTQADVDAGRAVLADLGKMWFVTGYSRVGGGDVVPP